MIRRVIRNDRERITAAQVPGSRELVLIQQAEQGPNFLCQAHDFIVVKVLLVEQNVPAEVVSEGKRGKAAVGASSQHVAGKRP